MTRDDYWRYVDANDFWPKPYPSAAIQWKGTDACIDLHCACGFVGHCDTEFLYSYQCVKCDRIYAVGSRMRQLHYEVAGPHGRLHMDRTDICADVWCACGATRHIDGGLAAVFCCESCNVGFALTPVVKLIELTGELRQYAIDEIEPQTDQNFQIVRDPIDNDAMMIPLLGKRCSRM